MRTSTLVATAIAVLVPAAAMAQTAGAPDAEALRSAERRLVAAERAVAEAQRAAEAARVASAEAAALATEARNEMARLRGTAVQPVVAAARQPEPVPAGAEQRIRLSKVCPTGTDIRSPSYAGVVKACERLVLARKAPVAAKARDVTGVGTTIAAAGSGSSATVAIENVIVRRSVRLADDGETGPYNLQRISRQSATLGVRADISKDDKGAATIATFGERDRLTSNVALVGTFGREFSRSERIYPQFGDISSVTGRANAAATKLEADCRKAAPADGCTGIGLVRWIFATGKDDAFANPEAVKLYNGVFWGPPTDERARFGWLVRGELARPRFSYFPFALTRVADPFKPGKTKTVIDPAQFPADFASRVTQDEGRLNWTIGARGYFHLSSERFDNQLESWSLSNWQRAFGFNAGTTFIGSLTYVRNDEIEKPFRDVRICPPAVAGQVFVTDQACTTVNIAAPVRKDGVVVGGEIRQGFEPMWFLPPMLLSAGLTHNLETDESGLAVPLYFRDAKGNFSGGIRFGHQWGGRNADGSQKRAESVIGVVIGASIDLSGAK